MNPLTSRYESALPPWAETRCSTRQQVRSVLRHLNADRLPRPGPTPEVHKMPHSCSVKPCPSESHTRYVGGAYEDPQDVKAAPAPWLTAALHRGRGLHPEDLSRTLPGALHQEQGPVPALFHAAWFNRNRKDSSSLSTPSWPSRRVLRTFAGSSSPGPASRASTTGAHLPHFTTATSQPTRQVRQKKNRCMISKVGGATVRVALASSSAQEVSLAQQSHTEISNISLP